MASQFYAIIAGAGSGTGAAAALKFAKSYPVVLLARQAKNYEPIVDQIRAAGGSAFGYTADAADSKSVDEAFAQIERDLKGKKLAAAVYNANAGFAIKPFLELKIEDLNTSLGTGL